ncbi:MAG: NADH-quinone oxidoreductase subunit L [Candidatus Bathyarchaeia archaeon]
MMELTEFSGWAVWLLPLFSSLLVPLIARAGEKARNAFVIVISAITAGLAFSLVPSVIGGEGAIVELSVPWIPQSVNAGVFIDPLSVLFSCLIAFFGVVIAVYSLGYMKGENGLTRYYFFLLLFIGSMIGLVISDNFLQLFIFWEMVGLCSYSLISFWYNRPESVKSGVKVFIMTRIGDIMLLGAIGILYASLGSFSFRYTMANLGTLPTSTITAVAFLVLGGAVAKSAQLPLHTWLYSAMEAPTSVSALLHAATMVKAGIYLVARFIFIAGPLVATLPLWLPSVAWMGVLTAFIGATMALYTPDIKGVLAYSTVSQLGFMMAALGTVTLAANASIGWFASLFHMMSHAFFEGLGFLLAGGIIHALGTRDMRLMGGLRKLMPITFGLSLIMILTTSGLPPFAAFFSKGAVITSVTEAGNLWQIILIYATTALTFAYSLRFMTMTFMGKKSEHMEKLHVHEAPKVMLAPAVVLAGLCVAWGFLMPWLGGFLGVEGETSLLGAFFSLETPIFLLILLPTGLLVYATYYKRSAIMAKIRGSGNPLTGLLKHGYFFDDFYERVVTRGILSFSGGVRSFEDSAFGRFPAMVAGFVISAAMAAHKYLDIMADELLSVIAYRTLRGASKMKKVPSTSLQHYIAAALLGFILILILIIVTIGV